MAFDRNKAHEVSPNGFLIENGHHISSGSTDPDGSSHVNPVEGDRYFHSDGSIWSYDSTLVAWIKNVFNEQISAEGTNDLFSSIGETVLGANYSTVAIDSTSGFPGAGIFVAVARRKSGNGITTVRLYNVDLAIELASIEFTDTSPLRKTTNFTLPTIATLVEVQAKVSTGSGEIFSAEIR